MSKKSIRPNGAEGTSQPRNLAKQAKTVKDVSLISPQGRAIGELDDAMRAIDSSATILKAIKRMVEDATVQQLAQVGIDMLSYQWACIDDTLSELVPQHQEASHV